MKRSTGAALLLGAGITVAVLVAGRVSARRRLDDAYTDEAFGSMTLGELDGKLTEHRVFDSIILVQLANDAGWPAGQGRIERSQQGVFLHFELEDGCKVSLELTGNDTFVVSSWSHPARPRASARAEVPAVLAKPNIGFEEFQRISPDQVGIV